MDVIKNLQSLKRALLLLTIVLIVTQFTLLSSKLPFELAFTQKNVGFFHIYLSKLAQSPSIWLPLLGFILAHIALQVILTLVIYWCIKNLSTIFPQLKSNIFLWGICLWIGVQLLIVLGNIYLFPYSFFSVKLAWLNYNPNALLTFLLIGTAVVSGLFILAFIKSFVRHRGKYLVFLGLVILLYSSHYLYTNFYWTKEFKVSTKPNVIIIITDSLRPQYALAKSKFPNNPYRIENIAAQSAFFNNTFTLLGRSSPGLVAILTGDYPKTTGARFNLIPSQFVRQHSSLSHILTAHDYQTIFMADGRQFISLDPSYGFEQIIAAKGGIYDFIFSFINDTPLSNLILNTRLGEFLFPYNFANRNSYYTYLPNSFVKLVDRKLLNRHPDKPVLMVTALTVAHWPYVWAQQPSLATIGDRYENSVAELDRQFADLMKLLSKRGLLKNSLIVVLSDHGDSLGLPGDRIITTENYLGPKELLNLIPRAPYTTKQGETGQLIGIDTSAGHGTDLLSLTQLNTTLAFYYRNVITPQIFNQRVALIDVTPTILDLLNIKSPVHFDGVSLKPLMFGQQIPELGTRPIFLETEIDIPLIDVTNINEHHSAVSSLIEQYANLYDINLATQQLVLRNDAVNRLLSEKQLGIIQGNYLLAYFPGKNALDTTILNPKSLGLANCYYAFPARANGKENEVFCYRLRPTIPYFVLVNLITKQWQILFTSDTSNNPIFAQLLGKLREFYLGEF